MKVHQLIAALGAPLVLMLVGKLVELRLAHETLGLVVFGIGAAACVAVTPLAAARSVGSWAASRRGSDGFTTTVAVVTAVLVWYFLSLVVVVNFHLWLGGTL